MILVEPADSPSQQGNLLNALHRRVVLDKAREALVSKYGFTTSELRLDSCNNYSEKMAELPSLVASVRAKLNAGDSGLLSADALWMIFDGGKGTVRDAGNEVAHGTPVSELNLAVLGAGLSPAQVETLSKIYKFAREEEPPLQFSVTPERMSLLDCYVRYT